LLAWSFKLEALKTVINGGIPTVIANGRRAGLIAKIAAGEKVDTRFVVGGKKRLSS
jgi:glutamate 5-kinase